MNSSFITSRPGRTVATPVTVNIVMADRRVTVKKKKKVLGEEQTFRHFMHVLPTRVKYMLVMCQAIFHKSSFNLEKKN